MVISMIKEFQEFAERHIDPVRDITEFIAACRNSGMDQNQTIAAMMNQYCYNATEAEIVVRDFWNQTA